jgi:hypothetical protein
MTRRSKHLTALLVAAAAMLAAACQGSATNVVGPGGTKCAISLQASAPSIDAAGGKGTVTVTAAAECVWRASTDASWIAITSDATGQGTGVIHFTASGNPASSMRKAAVIVAESRVELAQVGAPCQFNLTPASETFGSASGEGAVNVSAAIGCQWSAASGASWLSVIGSSSGSGSGTVRYQVDANTGATRDGTLTVAGQTFAVNQAGAGTVCTVSIGRSGRSVSADGDDDVLAVTAAGPCPWTATSQAAWITVVEGASGNGTGTVRLRIAANPGAPRVGLVTITGHTYVVTQAGTAASCSYGISAPGHSAAAEGGAATVIVSSQPGCTWTTASHAPWISVASGAVGNGPGTVVLSIAPNTGAQRAGQVTIAGQAYAVTQAAATAGGGSGTGSGGSGGDGGTGGGGGGTGGGGDGGTGGGSCSFSIGADGQSIGSAGGPATIDVQTASGCAWTAQSNAAWISVTDGGTRSGVGTVHLTVVPNTGAQRVGTVTVAGRTHTITQAAGILPCSFSINSSTFSSPAGGGATSVGVTTTGGCQWTAESHAAWITITSGSTGTGIGTVQLTIAANTAAERVGTVTIAGRTFTVTQASGIQACTYTVSPATQSVSLLGGEFTVNITTQSGCAWTAGTENDWIVFTTAPNGVGSGTVRYRVPTVSLGLLFSREGRMTIGGETVTVQQKGLLANGS